MHRVDDADNLLSSYSCSVEAEGDHKDWEGKLDVAPNLENFRYPTTAVAVVNIHPNL